MPLGAPFTWSEGTSRYIPCSLFTQISADFRESKKTITQSGSRTDTRDLRKENIVLAEFSQGSHTAGTEP
jgi:hypothetical protein